MTADPRFTKASQVLFTADELKASRDNWNYATRRFPDEMKKVAQIISDRSLTHHPVITRWFAKNKSPMPVSSIALLDLYKESSFDAGKGLPVRMRTIVKR